MDVRTLTDLWVKAAVEHNVLQIKYMDSDQKTALWKVQPDTVFKEQGVMQLRATFCYDTGVGPCKYRADRILHICWTNERFSPNLMSLTDEMLRYYKDNNLSERVLGSDERCRCRI